MFYHKLLSKPHRFVLDKMLRLMLVGLLVTSLAIFSVVLQAPVPAFASHYRATQLTWTKTTTARVATFTLTATYRRSYFSPEPNVGDTFQPSPIDYGDGTSDTPTLTAIAVDLANDTVTAEGSFNHTYSADGPYTAAISDCCRLSSPLHINNPDGSIRVETIVSFPTAAGSPESTLPPIVDCPKNGVCNFSIPATDPAGLPIRYRFSTDVEASGSSGGFVQPSGATVSSSGLYSWNTTGQTLAPPPNDSYYSTQVTIESFSGSTVVSKVALDFFIRITASGNAPPAFIAPTPADGTTINASVGSPVSFNVAANDPNATFTVTLGIINKPAGSTFTATTGNPATGAFAWTPIATGTYILNLTAQDQNGLSAVPRSITIVVNNPAGGYVYYLPFLANSYVPAGAPGGFTSFLTFQNAGSTGANVTLQYYDANGNGVAPSAGTCASVPLHGECTPPNPFAAGARGSGVLTSSQPLAVIVSEATPYGGSAYPVVVGSANQLVAPFAINNSFGGFITQLNVLNAGGSPVNVNVSFYKDDGSPFTTQTVTIQPHTTTTLDQTAGAGALPVGFNGWAQVTAPTGSQLVGQVLEQNPNNHFVAIANATAVTQSTLNAAAIFNGAFGTFVTGSNIINPGANPVTVSITYYDTTGKSYVAAPFTLNAHAVASVYQGGNSNGRGVPPGGLVAGFAGAAVINVTGGSVVIEVNEGGGVSANGAAKSGVYSAAAAGGGNVALPVQANGGVGFFTGTTILNTTNATAAGTIQYYKTDGTPQGSAIPFNVGPFASKALFQGDPSQALPPNFYGVAVVSESSGPAGAFIITTNAASGSFFYTFTEPSQ